MGKKERKQEILTIPCYKPYCKYQVTLELPWWEDGERREELQRRQLQYAFYTMVNGHMDGKHNPPEKCQHKMCCYNCEVEK